MSKAKTASVPSSKLKLVGIAVLSFAGAYIFSSLAIHTGRLWYYFFGVTLIILGIKFLIRSFQIHGNK